MEFFLWKRSWYHKWRQYILKTSYRQPSHSFKGFWSKKDTTCSRLQKQKLCSLFKTQDPENHILFRCTYPFRSKRWHPGVGHWGYKRFWLFWLFSLICQKARVRGVGRHFFRLSPGGYSLRASSPIWAREASFAKTRERGAEERLRCSLARSRETRFARPKSRACSQAKEVKGSILIHYTFLKCAVWTHGTHVHFYTLFFVL